MSLNLSLFTEQIFNHFMSSSLAQGSVKEPETELRKLVEAVTVEKAPARKTPAQSGKVTPQPHSPEVKAGVLLEIAQVYYRVQYVWQNILKCVLRVMMCVC